MLQMGKISLILKVMASNIYVSRATYVMCGVSIYFSSYLPIFIEK